MSRKSLMALLILGWACIPGNLEAQTFLNKNAQAWLTDLDKGNAGARRGAAFALGKLAAGSALNALEKSLQKDKDVWVREAAAYALGEIGRSSRNDQLLPVLTTALEKDASPVVRRSAAFALGCLGPDALPALPLLETAQKDESPTVRQSVAWALAKIGARGIPGLKKALHDKDALVKRDAANTMEPLEVTLVRPLISDLAQLCREENSDVRRAALGVLIKLVTPEDGQYIRDIAFSLKDDDEEVRNYAALTLANIGGPDSAQAVPQLLNALRQQGSLELRRQAAVGIRNIGTAAKSAVPDLIAALKDKDGEMRTHAALALGGIGIEAQAAYEALLQRVEDSNEKAETRVEAAYALSRLGRCAAAVKAVPRILNVLGNAKEPNSVRGRAMWALRVHYLNDLRGMGLYPTFYKVLAEGKSTNKDDDNKMLRYDCAFMLGKLQRRDVQPQVLETLLEFLRDDKIQIAVGKTSSVGGVGKETGSGAAAVEETGKGDGRVMAVDALTDIGPLKLVDQPAIITELRALTGNNATYEDLRKMSGQLLKMLKK